MACTSVSVAFIDKVCKIDDPVGAVSVHGVGGLLGTILTGVFANPAIYTDPESAADIASITVGTQTIGALAVTAFAFVLGLIIFLVIKHTHGLRVEKRIEEEGLDIYEHGEAAYN